VDSHNKFWNKGIQSNVRRYELLCKKKTAWVCVHYKLTLIKKSISVWSMKKERERITRKGRWSWMDVRISCRSSSISFLLASNVMLIPSKFLSPCKTPPFLIVMLRLISSFRIHFNNLKGLELWNNCSRRKSLYIL